MLAIDVLKLVGSEGGGGSGDLSDTSVGGTTYAQWMISNDGFTYRRTTSGVSRKGSAWINPQTGLSNYEVRATLVNGDTPDGTFDTWLSMASFYTWGWADELDPKSCEILIELRRASDGVVIDSATISLFVFGIL